VYALGTLSYEFASDAIRDSIMQDMDEGANPYDQLQLLAYLERNPWDATSVVWTLNVDGVPLYAIVPRGPFADEAYARLRKYLGEQLKEGVERVSVPGVLKGSAKVPHFDLPVIQPEIRGLHSWTVTGLIHAVCGNPPPKEKPREYEAYTTKLQGLKNFLERIYYELRNRGLTPQERAMNYAASNAFNVAQIFERAIKDGMELDRIEVERSPISRPRSDCWDVKLRFFEPARRLERAAKVYLFTVDVSAVYPVALGGVRSWSVY
jgi:cyanobactin maturation PatA/PatG family protease